MINTYQTSLAPPPVPPRLNRAHPVLIPEPLPSRGHSKPLIRFLVGVVVLHFFLSVAGFIYLYNEKMEKLLSPEGKAEAYSVKPEKQAALRNILARMTVEQRPHSPNVQPTPGFLKWDIKHSLLKGVSYSHNVWLTVLQPGDYYVYSRVTFSKADPVNPLASEVKLRRNETDKEVKTVMQAYCHLGGTNSMCTASQGGVITLERGNQLSVRVQDLLLVNYEEGATAFGMYKL